MYYGGQEQNLFSNKELTSETIWNFIKSFKFYTFPISADDHFYKA